MLNPDWLPFLSFKSRVSAEATAAILESEGVPTLIVAVGLVAALEAEFQVLVPRALVHRARWVLGEYEFSESELRYLATGELGDSA